VFQINKDPDVRLDPFFVVGEEIPKKVWLWLLLVLQLSPFLLQFNLTVSVSEQFLNGTSAQYRLCSAMTVSVYLTSW